MKALKFSSLFITLLLSILFSSCSQTNKNNKKYMPNISGKEGDILIVVEKNIWESKAGAKIHSILTQEFPALPQREPMFTIYNTPHKTFDGSFRFHRNIVVMEIDKSIESTKILYERDKWALPQTVVTILANNIDDATSAIEKDEEKIINCFEQAERDRTIKIVRKFEEKRIQSIIKKTFGASISIPKDFVLKRSTDNFAWIAYETTFVNQGLLMYKYPYNKEEGLTSISIIRERDKALMSNIPGMRPNSYMTTSSFIPPSFKNIKYKKTYFSEIRGLWELKNDYMGGPFVSHSFIDKTGENVIVIECFVYAPKYDKREYLRYVESILYTFEWEK